MRTFAFVSELIARGGPQPSDYPVLDAWCARIHASAVSGELTDADLLALREAFGDAIYYRDDEPRPAVRIASINTALGFGEDNLYRADDGSYYLERHREPKHGGYSELHRINLNAAILWAIEQVDEVGLLRAETAAAIMGFTSYADPHPNSYYEISEGRQQPRPVSIPQRVLSSFVKK